MAMFHTAPEGAATIAQRCDQARDTTTGWTACCPAHEDRSPSLSITPTDDRVLLYCHAGCTAEAIVATLGLEMRDLFAGDHPRGLPPARRPPAAAPPPPASSAGPPRVTAIYPYDDAQGAVLYRVLRWEPGRHGEHKSFTQEQPDPAHPGAWLPHLRGVTRVLYHLPEVLRAVQAGEPIYLPEGEKDTNNVRALGLTATTNAGGAGKWEPQYTDALRGAHVVLLQDNDAAGRRHTAVVTQALHGVAASLEVVELAGLPPKGDVSDWLAAGGDRAQLEALVAQTPLWTPSAWTVAAAPDTPEPPVTPRPVIRITTDIPHVVNQGQDALQQLLHGPVLYQRARRLCLMARGARPPRWLHRPQDMPVMMEASPAHLYELAAQAAQWEKYDKRGQAWEPALPPRWFVDALQGRPAWPFPPLEGIIHSPTLRPDGSLLDTPGYDEATGLVFDSNGTTFPPLSLRPTLDDARAAIACLQEPVMDFPFVAPWHCSATLAAMLSLVCRFTIMGNIPLFAIRAHTRGSGKSLLADVVSIIGTGRAAPRWPQVTEDEEERKRLLTVALAGYPVIHIDNVTRPLGSPALDLALTASTFSDRLLGKHDSREVPLSIVWLASGNNMQFQGDTARRIVPIDLDPKMEHPEERTGFHHSPLVRWVEQERPRFTVAALTMVQAFFAASCPAQGLTPLGSFEPWSDLIRHALVWAGEADPCEGRKGLEAESDPEYERLAALLDAWAQCYPRHDAWTLAQVKGDIQTRATPSPQPPNQWNALQEALGALDKKYDGKSLNTQVLGEAFRRFQGRTISGRRFVTAGVSHHAQRWVIEAVSSPGGESGESRGGFLP